MQQPFAVCWYTSIENDLLLSILCDNIKPDLFLFRYVFHVCMSLMLGITPSVFLHMLVSTLPLTPTSLSEDSCSIDSIGIEKV